MNIYNLTNELLGDILCKNIIDIQIDNNKIIFSGNISNQILLDWSDTIQINELMIKCKIWAAERGFELNTSIPSEMFTLCELIFKKGSTRWNFLNSQEKMSFN